MKVRSAVAMTAVLVCVLLYPAGAGLCASVDEDRAAQVKAAYLYHLARLAHWPQGSFSSEQDSLRIGVLGKDRRDLVGLFLNTEHELKAGEHPFRIERIDDDHDTLRQYHIVFFTESTDVEALRHLDDDDLCGVLLAGEIESFCEHGGMVGFKIDGGRVRIEVNQEALSRGGIRLGAEFLQHATLVEGRR